MLLPALKMVLQRLLLEYYKIDRYLYRCSEYRPDSIQKAATYVIWLPWLPSLIFYYLYSTIHVNNENHDKKNPNMHGSSTTNEDLNEDERSIFVNPPMTPDIKNESSSETESDRPELYSFDDFFDDIVSTLGLEHMRNF